MVRKASILVCLVCLLGAGGCSITGSWRTVTVDPPDQVFPVETITFDRSRNYTATWKQAGKKRTTLGQYRWNGLTLDVVRAGNRPQSYRAALGLDGKLVLTYGRGASKVKAVMERVKPVPDSKRHAAARPDATGP